MSHPLTEEELAMHSDIVKLQRATIQELTGLLQEAHDFMVPHENWSGECPMNMLTEFNATILEPKLEELRQ
jgi:hypothetical protein